MRRLPRWRTVALFLLLAGAYFASGKLGLTAAFLHPSASPIWPPTGIALVSLLAFGLSYWPAIFVGAFLVNVTTAGTIATSLGIATGNTVEAVIGAVLVRRYAGGAAAFERPQDVIRFVALAGLLATAVSATIGVASLALGGFIPVSELGTVWLTWWLGDAGGCLVLAPLLLLWARPSGMTWTPARGAEAIALFIAVALVSQFVFGGVFATPINRFPLAFLCVPFILWSAFRFGPRETATCILLLSVVAVTGTLSVKGSFPSSVRNATLLLLQAFLCVTSVTALFVAAVLSERRRTLADLERQAADLASSNAELEQFAYVASHDLQEPLRMVTSYLQLLEQRYGGRLDDNAHEFIGYAVDGAARMKLLIDGLLALSRVGRAGESVPTDSGSALERATANLALSIQESNAALSHARMPVVMAEAAELTQLFQNLIGNSLKFRGERRPEVKIEAVRRGDSWEFSVSDNGIGIPAEHAERIFVVFQRLHSARKYPGTGIGLALCKKIVERHRGRIWVESKPGEGATFRFTLPAADRFGADRTTAEWLLTEWRPGEPRPAPSRAPAERVEAKSSGT